ncbi:MAG TPA: N-acetyltransferase, partial [Lactobacillus sp.]|nr:N-acetyltransferase [Lactobacillus sp.]
RQPFSKFYFFEKEKQRLEMIRVITSSTGNDARISPLLILPKYQGHGYAQLMLEQIEQLYPTVHRWHLD